MTRQSSDVLAVDDPDVTAARAFLRDHGHLPLRVADVLGGAGVAPRAGAALPRDCFSRGLARRSAACTWSGPRHLLATTELSMAEVAEQAGFASQPQLSRVFRQKTGLTPTAYRRQARSPAGSAWSPRFHVIRASATLTRACVQGSG